MEAIHLYGLVVPTTGQQVAIFTQRDSPHPLRMPRQRARAESSRHLLPVRPNVICTHRHTHGQTQKHTDTDTHRKAEKDQETYDTS